MCVSGPDGRYRAGVQITLIDGTTHTRNHWQWGRGWQPGRRKYALHLTWEHAPEVHRISAAAHEALGGVAELDLIPQQWLHLTMTGIGFTDEVSEEQVTAITDPVFDAWQHLASPGVEFTGFLVADEAIMLQAELPEWLAVFIELQRTAVDEVLGPQPWKPFHPHVSLSYSNGTTPIEPIVDAVHTIAAGLPETVDATPALTLLRIGKDNRMYEWDVLRGA